MFKDIEYERDGVKKMASERFKDDLIDQGWNVVAKKVSSKKKEEEQD